MVSVSSTAIIALPTGIMAAACGDAFREIDEKNN